MSRSVEEHQTWSAAQFVLAHRYRDRFARGHLIHAYRMGDAVFVQEGFESYRRHRRMVLEDGMQADDRHAGFGEFAVHAFCLWYGVAYAAWAQHLESVQKDHPPAHSGLGEWCGGIEPLADLPVGYGRNFVHFVLLFVA